MSKNTEKDLPNECVLPAEDLLPQSSNEVLIEYLPEMPRGNPERRIHERPKAPPVKEGNQIKDQTPSPKTNIKPRSTVSD